MPAALYTSPYAKFELSLDEKEQLHNTAQELISDCQEHYESFLTKDNSVMGPARWSLVLKRDDVRVFQDRRPPTHKDFYHFLTVGNVNGTLSDAMYGELNHTTDGMRLKTAYVKDTLLDCAVLETILAPTEEDPFQSMTLRWSIKGIPAFARLVGKHRSNVYLEATGIRVLSNGERVGFHLMHSVSSPKTPPMPNYDRIDFSMCSFWRQVSPQSVHVFRNAVGYMNESKLVLPLAIKSSAEALVSVHRILDCAQLKKLTYLVQKKLSVTRQEVTGSPIADGCSVCGARTACTRRGVKSTCVICSKITGSRCRVKRRIFTIGLDRQLCELKMRFCTPCLSSTARLHAYEVAKSDLQDVKSENLWVMARSATSTTSSIASYSDSSSFSSSRS